MLNLHSFSLILSALATVAQSQLVMNPIDTPRLGKHRRSDPQQDLQLQPAETFLWSGADNSSSVMGNMTVQMPGDDENVLSLERFKSLLSSVECTNSTVDLTFKNSGPYSYAQREWDWVNGTPNKTFVLVAGAGDCGWNDHRLPFTISDTSYNNQTQSVHMTANATTWADVFHSYTLQIGALPEAEAAAAGLTKRGSWTKGLNIDFTHDMEFTPKVLAEDPVEVTIGCPGCNTQGSFAFSLTLVNSFFTLKQFTVTAQATNVALTIAPQLKMKASLTDEQAFEERIITVPLGGIVIPGGILELGPELAINAGAVLSEIEGEATISTGAVISLPADASASFEIIAGTFQSTTWEPTLTTQPLELDAEIKGTAKAFVNAELALALRCLGHGYDIGLTLAPYVQGDLKAIATTGTACPGDDAGHHFGVEFTPSFGVDLSIGVQDSTGKSVMSKDLSPFVEELSTQCFGFGSSDSEIAAADITSITGDGPAEPSSAPTTVTGDAAEADVTAFEPSGTVTDAATAFAPVPTDDDSNGTVVFNPDGSLPTTATAIETLAAAPATTIAA